MGKLRVKYVIVSLCSYITFIGPLLITVLLNHERYIKSTESAVRLSVGGMIAALIILLMVLGKMKIPRRIVAAAAICVMSYLLESLLQDLFLLSGMWLLGELIDFLFFRTALERLRKKLDAGKEDGQGGST